MRILFVCYANACRSQMAHAWARHRAPGLEVESAGLMAAGLQRRTVQVLEEAGVDTAGLRSETLEQVAGRGPFDVVVSLADRAHGRCAELAREQGAEHLHWPVLDPAGVRGSEEEKLEMFRLTLDDVSTQVDALLEEKLGAGALRPRP